MITATYISDQAAYSAGLVAGNLPTVTVRVGLTTATTVSASAPSGSSVTLTASVAAPSGTPTGTITFFDGTTAVGTASLNNGTASLSLTSLTVGTHQITASYGGDTNDLPSTSAATSITIKNASTTSVSIPSSASAGSSLVINATVTSSAGTPTGSITFSDGNTTLGSANLANGTATYTVQNISAGNHSFTAAYSGDANFGSSLSSAATLNVAADFTVALPASTGPVVLAAGKAATINISVAPQPGGFSSPVQFSCTGLPALANCSFSPPSITPGSSPANTTLTISTVAPTAAHTATGFGLVVFTALPFAGLLAGGGKKRRIRRRHLFLIVTLAVIVVSMVACGGGGPQANSVTHQPGTPAGTYTVAVVAQSGQITHSTNLTLTVQ